MSSPIPTPRSWDNDKVVSLGNPEREEFLTMLHTALRQQIEEAAS